MQQTKQFVLAAAAALWWVAPCADEVQQVSVQPPSIAPTGGVVRFSIAVSGVPAPGMRSYALGVRFEGAAVDLVEGEMDTASLSPDRLSCSARLRSSAALETGQTGGHWLLESGQGQYTLDTADGASILSAANRIEGNTAVYNFGSRAGNPQPGGGELVDFRCFGGGNLADGTVVYVVPQPWRFPATGQTLAGAILLDQTDPTPVVNRFAWGVIHIGDPTPRLDVDADGRVDALTDGLLALRYAHGLRGTQLTTGATGAACRRCDPARIAEYLQASANVGILDADGDQRVDPRTDGQLILRYQLGLRGWPLIAGGIVGAGCGRCDAVAIEPYLQGLAQ